MDYGFCKNCQYIVTNIVTVLIVIKDEQCSLFITNYWIRISVRN